MRCSRAIPMMTAKRNRHSLKALVRYVPAMFMMASLLVSCNRRPPKVLSDGEMEDLLVDIEIAGAYSSRNVEYSSDSMRLVLVNSVLEKHGVTREQLDSTMSWYGRNMDVYDKVMDKVDRRIASLQKSSASGADDLSGDNLWPYMKHVLVSEEGDYNGLSFSLNSPEVETGGVVLWQMRFTPTPRLSALLGVEYDNGKKEYVEKLISGAKKVELELQTDTSLNVRRVFGNVSVIESASLPLWVDSISIKAIPLVKENYYKRYGGVKSYEGPKLKVKEPIRDGATDSITGAGTRIDPAMSSSGGSHM